MFGKAHIFRCHSDHSRRCQNMNCIHRNLNSSNSLWDITVAVYKIIKLKMIEKLSIDAVTDSDY